jgi:hypothetical protein
MRIIASCGKDVRQRQKDSAGKKNILARRMLSPRPIGFRYRPIGKSASKTFLEVLGGAHQ